MAAPESAALIGAVSITHGFYFVLIIEPSLSTLSHPQYLELP
jgi:hypothetical protein